MGIEWVLTIKGIKGYQSKLILGKWVMNGWVYYMMGDERLIVAAYHIEPT